MYVRQDSLILFLVLILLNILCRYSLILTDLPSMLIQWITFIASPHYLILFIYSCMRRKSLLLALFIFPVSKICRQFHSGAGLSFSWRIPPLKASNAVRSLPNVMQLDPRLFVLFSFIFPFSRSFPHASLNQRVGIPNNILWFSSTPLISWKTRKRLFFRIFSEDQSWDPAAK